MSTASSPKTEFDLAALCRTIGGDASPMGMAALEGAGHVIRYVNLAFCRLAR